MKNKLNHLHLRTCVLVDGYLVPHRRKENQRQRRWHYSEKREVPESSIILILAMLAERVPDRADRTLQSQKRHQECHHQSRRHRCGS